MSGTAKPAVAFKALRSLADEDPDLGAERVPGALRAYPVRSRILRRIVDEDSRAAPLKSEDHVTFLCEAVFWLASLEYAAGAAPARCRAWLARAADVARGHYGAARGEGLLLRSVAYRVLAGDLSREQYRGRAPSIASLRLEDRFIYAVGTGRPFDWRLEGDLLDDRLWRRFADAFAAKNVPAATSSLEALMHDWFIQFGEEPDSRDLVNLPVCDWLLNAALVLTEESLGTRLSFSAPVYEELFLLARVSASVPLASRKRRERKQREP